MTLRNALQQICKLFDADPQILDDSAQSLTLQFALMHGDHYAGIVASPNIVA